MAARRCLQRQPVSTVFLMAAALAFSLWAGWAVEKARPRVSWQPEFSGTVYLPNGQPARKVTLEGHGTATHHARSAKGFDVTGMSGVPGLQLVTDAEGRYQLQLEMEKWHQGPTAEHRADTYSMLLYSPDGLGYAQIGSAWSGGVKAGGKLNIYLREGDRVEGRVVGYPGPKPLAGVEVAASLGFQGFHGHAREPAEKAVTDEDGGFRMRTSLPPNGYGFETRPAGWAVMETKIEPPPSEVPARRAVDIRLVRPYTIRGRAYGRDGQPLCNTQIGVATTDETGAFATREEGWTSPYGEGPYLSRYATLAPKLADGDVAYPVIVDATDPATQVIELHFAPPGTVTARQVDTRTGKPAEDVWARLVPVWPSVPPEQWDALGDRFIDQAHSITKDDPSGNIVLRGVPPGEYRLQLEAWMIQGLTAANGNAIPVTVKPGETTNIGTVQVVYVPHLAGQFSGSPWKPDPKSEEEVRGVLRPSGSTSTGGEGYMSVRAGGGKYTLWANGRSSGTYDVALVASKDNVRYVTQVLHNLTLQDDVPLAGINVQFTRGASVHGKVVQANGKPLPGTAVAARGVGGDAVMFEAFSLYGDVPAIGVGAATDSNREFALEGLLPGEYELTAQVEPGAYGPQPTARVRVGARERKRGMVLRTARSG